MITLTLANQHLPLYQQIYLQLKADIYNGTLPAHTKIMSKRKLANHLQVSLNTVDTAYSQLVSEGFLYSQPQKGYYICQMDSLLMGQNPPQHQQQLSYPIVNSAHIDCSPSRIAQEAFPFALWRKLMNQSFQPEDSMVLCCSTTQGYEPLRNALAVYLYQSRGVHCRPEQIIIGAGTEQLLQMLSYILANQYTMVIEDPVYHNAADFFKRMGHNVIPIAVDHLGMPVEPLDTLHHTALYITPSNQFPLGMSMPIHRRIQLLNWANQGTQRYIIEDDYDSEFRYHTKPIPSLQSIDTNHKVIYLGTFSKSIAPSLRMSYMILPDPLLHLYHSQYLSFRCAVSRLEQSILHQFITQGHFETHLNKMRKLYKTKRTHLITQLQQLGDGFTIHGEDAGHHLLVQSHTGISEIQLCNSAYENGVKVYPLSPYFSNKIPPSHQNKVLLGYGGLSLSEISQVATILKASWTKD